jgi:cytoskeletal protein RodZ
VNDDDVLRRALHDPTEPINSYRVLLDLRPTMRRARHRRRVAAGATAALLLVGGGAGVLAVTSAPGSPTAPTTSSDDDKGAAVSTLPPVSEPRDMADTDTPGLQAVPTTAAASIPIEPPASTPTGEGQPEPPETTPKPDSPGVTPPSDQLPPATPATPAAPAAPTPVAPAAPQQPAGPTSQALTSVCGDVVVEFDERTVRITSIASLPGYTSQVSTDGPESVEVKFLGAGSTCEVHAELEQSGLDVEIQNSDHDD